MAVNPSIKWPTRTTAVAPAYPYGSSKDETTPGANDGTPYEKARADDIFGFQQALLKSLAIVPSGNADTAEDSQYLQAVVRYAAGAAEFLDDTGAANAYIVDPTVDIVAPDAYFAGMVVSFIPDNTNTGASTINVNSIGVKSIKKEGTTDPDAGDITGAEIVTLMYDGTNFQIVNILHSKQQAIRDVTRGLTAATNGVSQVDITADEIVLQSANGTSRKFSSVSETADITVSGADGLDTGSEAADTWYYTWIIAKTDGTVASLLSVSSTAPTMPSGYTLKALTGAVRNSGTSNFIPFEQTGNKVVYNAAQIIKNGSFTTIAWTSIGMTSFFPSTAASINTVIGSSGEEMGISPRSDGHAGFYSRAAGVPAGGDPTFGGVITSQTRQVTFDIKYEDTMYYYVNTAAATWSAIGWEY